MFDEARCERLVSGYLDGQLTAAERRELEEMLLSSARARQLFHEQAGDHGLMREWALRSGGLAWMEAPAEGTNAARRRKRWPWPLGLGAAAALALAAGWWALKREPVRPVHAQGEPPAGHVALLAQAIDVDWDGPGWDAGAALPKGLLKLRKGTLRLDFYSGARVLLEGPASLELLSRDVARLESGKLTARVPPAAEGFTILNADLRVVDRGTEFGMRVSRPGECEVHVFDGRVELQGEVPAATGRDLNEGQAVAIREGRATAMTADRGSFVDAARVLREAQRQNEERRDAWGSAAERFRSTPDLRIYYDFEGLEPGESLLPNRASGAGESTAGSIIGCERLSGRWPGKAALGFAKTSDRVRFRTEGSTSSLTLSAWVRVDSLPQDHNSLLSMSPGVVGEVHWKLDRAGRLLLGLRASPEFSYEAWERLESPPIVGEQDFGRWLHLTTVIDGEGGTMRHYVDGREVAMAPLKRRVPVRLGLGNLGNFDAGPTPYEAPVRSFNGRIDEFALLTRALSADEIAAMERP